METTGVGWHCSALAMVGGSTGTPACAIFCTGRGEQRAGLGSAAGALTEVKLDSCLAANGAQAGVPVLLEPLYFCSDGLCSLPRHSYEEEGEKGRCADF